MILPVSQWLSFIAIKHHEEKKLAMKVADHSKSKTSGSSKLFETCLL